MAEATKGLAVVEQDRPARLGHVAAITAYIRCPLCVPRARAAMGAGHRSMPPAVLVLLLSLEPASSKLPTQLLCSPHSGWVRLPWLPSTFTPQKLSPSREEMLDLSSLCSSNSSSKVYPQREAITTMSPAKLPLQPL